MNEITFDVGLAAKLKQAVIRNGLPDLADIDWLCEGDNLASIRRLRQGHAQLIISEHLIDCDANPFLPDGWKVEEHKRGGQLTFDLSQIELYLDAGQKKDKYIEGNKLRQRLADKPVLNANVLDYLIANPHLIPEEWKKDEQGNTRYIFFWGTVYCYRDGSLCVRCLCWHGGGWRWSDYWLDDAWYGDDPSALRAS